MRRPLGRLRRAPRAAAAALLVLAGVVAVAVVLLPGAAPLTGRTPAGGSAAGGPPAAFYDTFAGETLAPARWQVSGGGEARPLQGELVLGSQGPPAAAWGSPGLYSAGALPARAGRTVVSVARPGAAAVRGPLFLLSPSPFPADPTRGGYGVGFDSLGGDDGNGGADLRLSAITPEGQFLYDREIARPVDYLMATTLRPEGSYHFVSGGAFGTFPAATLIWVGNAGGAGAGNDLYVGVDAKDTAAAAASVKVVDLPAEFGSPFGLARAADTFQPAAAPALGRTEVGGFAWRTTAGAFRREAGGIVREGQAPARAVFDPKLTDGIFETTVRTPEGPFAGPALYFRFEDEQNWWRFRCSADSVDLVRSAGGVESVAYQTGSISCAPGQTYRIVVRAHGPNINVWMNQTGVTFSVGVTADGPVPAAATGVGVGVGEAGAADAGAPSPVIDQVVAWPRTVTLPAAAGPAPSVPGSGERPLAQDIFTGPNPTRLQNRRPSLGGPWREYAGTWVAGGGRLVPVRRPDEAAQDSLAAVSTGLTDVAAAATVDLEPSGQEAPDAVWVGGPIVRYTDGKSFVLSRLVYGAAGAQVELWESADGASRFLGTSDVTGLAGAGGRHTLKLAALGQRIAAYVDDVLVLEASTAVLDGTWAGLLVSDSSLPAAFTDFRVSSVRPDTVPPPPVVDLDVATAPGTPPVLTWPPAVDDAAGTRYYRIFRSTEAGVLGRQINEDGETAGTTFTDARVPGGGNYCYTVSGVDGAGNSAPGAPGAPGDPAGAVQRCAAYERAAAP